MIEAELRIKAIEFLKIGIDSVSASNLIWESVSRKKDTVIFSDLLRNKIQINLSEYDNVYIIGAGKASAAMAEAIEPMLEPYVKGGLIITNKGNARNLKYIECFEAAHPLPDRNGVEATEKIIEICKNASEKDLIVFLLSGGASSLLAKPVEAISLSDKIQITQLLLNSGATIQEINTIRKRISQVKGGKLAALAYPAQVICLIISDVVGDDIQSIGSGPTALQIHPNQSCSEIINKYDLSKNISASLMSLLEDEEKNGTNFNLVNVKNLLIGNNQIALNKIKKYSESNGFHTIVVSKELTGEAKVIGRELVEFALNYKNHNKNLEKICLLFGGETTVTVTGIGKGGRNQELCLSAAIASQSIENFVLLSSGSDGIDGVTDAAGAVCDGRTIKRSRSLDMAAQKFLDDNDSYNFFRQLDDLIITGPTSTNVMDIQIILIG